MHISKRPNECTENEASEWSSSSIEKMPKTIPFIQMKLYRFICSLCANHICCSLSIPSLVFFFGSLHLSFCSYSDADFGNVMFTDNLHIILIFPKKVRILFGGWFIYTFQPVYYICIYIYARFAFFLVHKLSRFFYTEYALLLFVLVCFQATIQSYL